MYSNVTTSTRNKFYKCTYVHLRLFHSTLGLLTHNATKDIRCRKVIRISALLMTFDMVTDWMNWKQWAELGGYSNYYFIEMYQKPFLFVAIVGTVLWIIEGTLMMTKAVKFYSSKTTEKQISQLPAKRDPNECDNTLKKLYRKAGSSCSYFDGCLRRFSSCGIVLILDCCIIMWNSCKTREHIGHYPGDGWVVSDAFCVDK